MCFINGTKNKNTRLQNSSSDLPSLFCEIWIYTRSFFFIYLNTVTLADGSAAPDNSRPPARPPPERPARLAKKKKTESCILPELVSFISESTYKTTREWCSPAREKAGSGAPEQPSLSWSDAHFRLRRASAHNRENRPKPFQQPSALRPDKYTHVSGGGGNR